MRPDPRVVGWERHDESTARTEHALHFPEHAVGFGEVIEPVSADRRVDRSLRQREAGRIADDKAALGPDAGRYEDLRQRVVETHHTAPECAGVGGRLTPLPAAEVEHGAARGWKEVTEEGDEGRRVLLLPASVLLAIIRRLARRRREETAEGSDGASGEARRRGAVSRSPRP